MSSSTPGRKTPCDNHPYQDYTWIQLHEVVVDREYQLESARDELQKLSICESESKRKDEVISALRKEIAEYKKCTQSRDIRYASVEEHLSASESHLQERIKEVKELQSEMENMQRKLKSHSSKSAAVQKEVSKLSEMNAQQEEEIKNLKKQQKIDMESIAALRKELTEKKSCTGSLQERLKKMQIINQELQKRLEVEQAEQERLVTNERQLKAEISKLKNLTSSSQLLQAKHDFTEQELAKAKGKENAMAAEIGRLESELSELCGHLLACVQVPATEHNITAQAVLHAVTQVADDYFKVKDILSSTEQDLEESEENQSALNDVILSLCQCWKEFQGGVKGSVLDSLGLLATSLQKLDSEDDNFKEFLDLLRETICTLHSLEEQNHAKLHHMEKHIKDCYKSLEGLEAEEDVVAMITNMTDLLKSSTLQISKLNERLLETGLEHSASLSGAVTALRQDEHKRVNDAIEKVRLEEQEKLCMEVRNLKEQHDIEKQEAILKEQEISTALKTELESIKSACESEKKEKIALEAELIEAEKKLHAAEMNMSEAISSADSHKTTLESQFAEEMEGHKEQSKQYALTIVALEEKLLGIMESCKTLQTENESLKQHLDNVVTANSAELKGKDDEFEKKEKLLGVLRNQLALASVNISEKEAEIKHRDEEILNLKEEEDKLKEQHCQEVSDIQLTMAKQEAIIESQKSDLEQLNGQLLNVTSRLACKQEEHSKLLEEMSELQKNTDTSVSDGREGCLTEAGHVCLGEKHSEIINNQKIAISQLREKLNELELAKPPVASHQATLKELSRVRHELLKAKSDRHSDNTATATTSKQKEEVEFMPQFHFMEENKSREEDLYQLEQTLQCSERMYKNLVEAVCRALPEFTRPRVEDTELKASDEQQKKKEVLKERKKFADVIYKQLLLLVRAQQDANKSDSEIVSSSETEVGSEESPVQVIANLKAVLSVTAEELEQQKRLNQSLLKRKSFKESQQSTVMQKPRHNCVSTPDEHSWNRTKLTLDYH